MYKFVVFSALVAVCMAQGPLDTPEVALAKAGHLAALAEAHGRILGAPILPAPVPVIRHTPLFTPAPIAPAWKVWDSAATIGIHDDGKYRHDPSGDYRRTIVPTPVVSVGPTLPLPYQFAPGPAVIPATRLYDDGQYHRDIAGHYIHRLVPAPLN